MEFKDSNDKRDRDTFLSNAPGIPNLRQIPTKDSWEYKRGTTGNYTLTLHN